MIEKEIEELSIIYSDFHSHITDRIIGYDDIVNRLFISMMVEGNILLEGPPGVGKTSLVKTFSDYLGLDFSRIQFTPDIMPLDIIGSNILQQGNDGNKEFRFYKGPIFSNIVLGDEINRATPKTQSAFLEAMEEKKITFLGEEHPLPQPFMVLATQNPIELEGTYPLPEAQVDRFFMKLHFQYPDFPTLKQIISRNETLNWSKDKASPLENNSGILTEKLKRLKKLEEQVVVIEDVRNFITRLVIALHPSQSEEPSVKNYVLYGPSPRAGIALLRAAKWYALLDTRVNVSFDDVKELASDIMNHRIILNFDGEAENIDKGTIIRRLLAHVGRKYQIG